MCGCNRGSNRSVPRPTQRSRVVRPSRPQPTNRSGRGGRIIDRVNRGPKRR